MAHDITELIEIEMPALEIPAEPPQPRLRMELSIDPEDLPRLLRLPELRSQDQAANQAAIRRRPAKLSIIWHDTPDCALASRGLALAECHDAKTVTWRLERMTPDRGEICPPGGIATVLHEAEEFSALLALLPEAALNQPMVALAAFDGFERHFGIAAGGVGVTLRDGGLRAVAASRGVCRIILTGDAAPDLAMSLAAKLGCAAPRASLAAEAFALARLTLPARPLGAPALSPGMDVDTAFAFVIAHLAGVILHFAPLTTGQNGPEPVHQMRVALRRLRSALLLFRRATACPALDDAAQRLKQLGRVLGPPRDWDVFTAGAGREVGRAFADDPGVLQLLAAAERRRHSGYTALAGYLESPAFRELGIVLASLALTRPWRQHMPDDTEAAEKRVEMQTAELSGYAAKALGRRHAAVTAPGPDIGSLPFDALHDIRLSAKRLRYAAEFFSPLFPGRDTNRFLRRLGALQERLGHINDGAVAATLMAELPGRGAARAEAAGVVRGFVAAGARGGRRKIERSWQQFLKLSPFWN